MPTTFTIKQVPDALADALRARAATNRRSLQRELLLIMETAAQAGTALHVAEPPAPAYPARTSRGADKRRAKPAAPETARIKARQHEAARRLIAMGGSAPDALFLAAQLRGRATTHWSTDEILALTRDA
jgi:plasmid stability protein